MERRAEEVKNGARGGTELAKTDPTRQEPQRIAATSTGAQSESGGAATLDGDGPDDTMLRTFRQKATYENPMAAVVGSCGHPTPLTSTAGCGKPHVRWCGREQGRNPLPPTRSSATFKGTQLTHLFHDKP